MLNPGAICGQLFNMTPLLEGNNGQRKPVGEAVADHPDIDFVKEGEAMAHRYEKGVVAEKRPFYEIGPGHPSQR